LKNAADRIRRLGLILNAQIRPYRRAAAAANDKHGRGVDHGRGYKAALALRQGVNRIPDAVQRFFSGAPQSRDRYERCLRYGPGSAAHHHGASKTRVNALMAKNGVLRCVRGTRTRF
jgi:hypothetical protein